MVADLLLEQLEALGYEVESVVFEDGADGVRAVEAKGGRCVIVVRCAGEGKEHFEGAVKRLAEGIGPADGRAGVGWWGVAG